MKKLIILILLWSSAAWGATVYVKDTGAALPYYESGATSCDDVTAVDTNGDLEAALTAAGASGTLYICAGTYLGTELDSDSQIHIMASGVTINGVGTVTLDADGSNTVFVTGGYDNITLSNVSLRDASLAMFYITQGSTDIIINNCSFTSDQGGYGVYGMVKFNLDVTDITIQNSTFTSIPTHAVRFIMDGLAADGYTAKSHTFLINNNTFTNVTNNAIWWSYEDYSDSLSDSRVFYGVTVTNNVFSSISGFAIGGIFTDTSANLVSGNVATTIGSSGSAVNAFQFSACSGLTVEDNTISGVTSHATGDGHAIILDYSSDVGDSAPTVGAIVRRNKVSGCTSAGNSAGIKVFRCQDCEIYDNISFNNKMGISVSGSVSTGNVFYNNTVTNNTDRGFSADDSWAGGTVTNNIFYNNGDYGFYYGAGTTRGTESYNVVYGSAIENFFDDDEATNSFSSGVGDVISDPQLTSSTNFHLKANSPAIDAGVLVDTMVSGWESYYGDKRLCGDGPDIGADEYCQESGFPPFIFEDSSSKMASWYSANADLLLESDDSLLLETGDKLLLE